MKYGPLERNPAIRYCTSAMTQYWYSLHGARGATQECPCLFIFIYMHTNTVARLLCASQSRDVSIRTKEKTARANITRLFSDVAEDVSSQHASWSSLGCKKTLATNIWQIWILCNHLVLRMYVGVYVCMYTQVSAWTRKHTHTNIHVHTQTYTCSHKHTHAHTNILFTGWLMVDTGRPMHSLGSHSEY